MLLIVIGAISLLVAILYGKYFAFLALYPDLVDMVADFGVNIYLSRIVAVFVTIGLWVAIFKFLLSFSQKKREIGFFILLGLFVLHTFCLYIINLNRSVSVDGQVGFCTRDQITGRVEYFDRSLYDASGQKAEKCTKDEIRQLRVQDKYPNNEIPLIAIGNWFDENGSSLVYYYKDSQGVLHFRYMGGFAQTGEMWQQVTKEVLGKISPNLQSQFQQTKGDVVLRHNFDDRPNLKTLYRNSLAGYLIFFVFLNIVFWVVFLKIASLSFGTRASLIGLAGLVNLVGFCGIDYASSWSGLAVAVLMISLASPFVISFVKGFWTGMRESRPV